MMVLNLIINGIPSIRMMYMPNGSTMYPRFKPYYKWNTFNTKSPGLTGTSFNL